MKTKKADKYVRIGLNTEEFSCSLCISKLYLFDFKILSVLVVLFCIFVVASGYIYIFLHAIMTKKIVYPIRWKSRTWSWNSTKMWRG